MPRIKLIVSHRISPEMVYVCGTPMIKCKARKKTVCASSDKTIEIGDLVYRPVDNSNTRMNRFLASEVEAEELKEQKITHNEKGNV